MDVIMIRQPDGSLRSSPWHVEMGSSSTGGDVATGSRYNIKYRRRLLVKINGKEIEDLEVLYNKQDGVYFMDAEESNARSGATNDSMSSA
eukprot:gene9913-18857_t